MYINLNLAKNMQLTLKVFIYSFHLKMNKYFTGMAFKITFNFAQISRYMYPSFMI